MNGKQLKNSILQWAIQGKLVQQDPNDEPASVLLERIRAEKKRLIKEGKIKKDKNESIIFRGEDNSHYEKFADERVVCIDDEIPFEVPQGWEWARLNEVCSYIQRGKSPIYSEIKRYPVVAQKCNQWSGFSIDKAQFIAPDTIGKYTEERLLQENDLLWNSTGLGTLGRMAVYSGFKNPYGWAVADSHVTVIRPLQLFMNSFFLYAYFSSPTVQSVIEDKAEGSTKQKELYVDTVKTYLIPVPPYNEQNRIVAKIDAVLPRILKYGQSQDRLDKLNGELHERLRKSILQEAIQGRLVPQDLAEEPASVLLNHIQEEKQKLMKEGKLKKKDLVDSVIFRGEDNKYYEKVDGKTLEISEEIPFDIPESWAWVRLGSVVINEAGLAYSKDCLTDRSQPLIRVLRGGNIEEGRWSIKDDDVIISKKYVKDSLLLKRGTFITPAVTSIERMAKTALIQEDHHDIVVGGFVLMIKPVIIDNALLQYLNLFFQTTYYKKYCISITNKSGQAFYNLSRQKLMQCLVPIPPEKEQFRIADKYSQLTL